MAMTAEKLAYFKAYREAHKEERAAAFKRYHEAHGKNNYYENLDLTRAIKRKSYYTSRGNIEMAEKEQQLIDQLRLDQPKKQAGVKVKYSDEERVIRRKACLRKARYKHIKGIPFVAASFHGPTILHEPKMCEACGDTGKICMDHNHETLQFRGWLCDDCNLILGRAHDDIGVLKALVRYLEKRK